MRARSLLVAAGLVALLLGGATASYPASNPEITTVGAGGDVCRQWTQAVKEPGSRYQYRQWAFGFVSGYNWRNPSVQALPQNGEAVVAWIDDFCKVNPEVPIYVAAARMARQMEKPRNPPTAKKP
jgi:hypothetical protein